MTDLSGLLNRLFIEVTPLYALPKKTKGRKQAVGDLFALQPQVSRVQIVPGLFAERSHDETQDRPCFVVLEADNPIVLPATTADFAEADFKFRAYQIPLYTGKGKTPNVEERIAQKAVQSANIKLARDLDAALQGLLKHISESSLSPSMIHNLVEKLRVWSLEDYLQPSYLRVVAAGLVALQKELNDAKGSREEIAALKQAMQGVQSAIKSIEVEVQKEPKVMETFIQLFLQMAPTLAQDPELEHLFRSFIANPPLTRQQQVPLEGQAPSWLPEVASKSLAAERLSIHTTYTRFVHAQWLAISSTTADRV